MPPPSEASTSTTRPHPHAPYYDSTPSLSYSTSLSASTVDTESDSDIDTSTHLNALRTTLRTLSEARFSELAYSAEVEFKKRIESLSLSSSNTNTNASEGGVDGSAGNGVGGNSNGVIAGEEDVKKRLFEEFMLQMRGLAIMQEEEVAARVEEEKREIGWVRRVVSSTAGAASGGGREGMSGLGGGMGLDPTSALVSSPASTSTSTSLRPTKSCNTLSGMGITDALIPDVLAVPPSVVEEQRRILEGIRRDSHQQLGLGVGSGGGGGAGRKTKSADVSPKAGYRDELGMTPVVVPSASSTSISTSTSIITAVPNTYLHPHAIYYPSSSTSYSASATNAPLSQDNLASNVASRRRAMSTSSTSTHDLSGVETEKERVGHSVVSPGYGSGAAVGSTGAGTVPPSSFKSTTTSNTAAAARSYSTSSSSAYLSPPGAGNGAHTISYNNHNTHVHAHSPSQTQAQSRPTLPHHSTAPATSMSTSKPTTARSTSAQQYPYSNSNSYSSQQQQSQTTTQTQQPQTKHRVWIPPKPAYMSGNEVISVGVSSRKAGASSANGANVKTTGGMAGAGMSNTGANPKSAVGIAKKDEVKESVGVGIGSGAVADRKEMERMNLPHVSANTSLSTGGVNSASAVEKEAKGGEVDSGVGVRDRKETANLPKIPDSTINSVATSPSSSPASVSSQLSTSSSLSITSTSTITATATAAPQTSKVQYPTRSSVSSYQPSNGSPPQANSSLSSPSVRHAISSTSITGQASLSGDAHGQIQHQQHGAHGHSSARAQHAAHGVAQQRSTHAQMQMYAVWMPPVSAEEYSSSSESSVTVVNRPVLSHSASAGYYNTQGHSGSSKHINNTTNATSSVLNANKSSAHPASDYYQPYAAPGSAAAISVAKTASEVKTGMGGVSADALTGSLSAGLASASEQRLSQAVNTRSDVEVQQKVDELGLRIPSGGAGFGNSLNGNSKPKSGEIGNVGYKEKVANGEHADAGVDNTAISTGFPIEHSKLVVSSSIGPDEEIDADRVLDKDAMAAFWAQAETGRAERLALAEQSSISYKSEVGAEVGDYLSLTPYDSCFASPAVRTLPSKGLDSASTLYTESSSPWTPPLLPVSSTMSSSHTYDFTGVLGASSKSQLDFYAAAQSARAEHRQLANEQFKSRQEVVAAFHGKVKDLMKDLMSALNMVDELDVRSPP